MPESPSPIDGLHREAVRTRRRRYSCFQAELGLVGNRQWLVADLLRRASDTNDLMGLEIVV
jgi:hypothetical protein